VDSCRMKRSHIIWGDGANCYVSVLSYMPFLRQGLIKEVAMFSTGLLVVCVQAKVAYRCHTVCSSHGLCAISIVFRTARGNSRSYSLLLSCEIVCPYRAIFTILKNVVKNNKLLTGGRGCAQIFQKFRNRFKFLGCTKRLT
jgi:hypothetical protein